MLTRKRTIFLAVESEKGTKVAGTAPGLVYDLTMDPSAPYEERKGSGNFTGHNQPGTLGELTGSCKFRMEMRSTGAGAACEAALLVALQGCGMDATNLKPVSSPASQKTISIDVFKDGLKESLHGAMGTVTINAETGKSVFAEFEFTGIWTTTTDVAMPSYAPTTSVPMKMRGGTFTIGGGERKVGKFSLAPGSVVAPQLDVNADSGVNNYVVTDFDPVVSVDPEATLVATYDDRGLWLAGTEAAVVLAISDGTYKATITCPKVQYREVPEGDREGLMIYDITGQCNNDDGDDAFGIAFALDS